MLLAANEADMMEMIRRVEEKSRKCGLEVKRSKLIIIVVDVLYKNLVVP